MPFTLLDAGASLRTMTKCRVLDGGALRNIVRMKVMDADNTTLRTVATFVQPLTVSANDVYDEGFDSAYISFSTATPVGGLGPYTYAWGYISGTAMTVTDSTTATATFQSPVLTPGQSVAAVYRITCTDSSGQTATDDISVGFSFLSPP